MSDDKQKELAEALDREEKYLLEHFDADCGIMPGDVEGSFHRLRLVLQSSSVDELRQFLGLCHER